MTPATGLVDGTLLRLEGMTKRFGGVTALCEVDFDLRCGEIHAIVGENGAGKSTLIKILAGIHTPDAGTVYIDDREIEITDVTDADRLGIRVIHQELSLVPQLSLAENIYLGREPHSWGWLHRNRMYRDAEQLTERLQLQEIRNVRARVIDLSIAQKQLVEIARALSTQARILILDEPTSSLSESETDALFARRPCHLGNLGTRVFQITYQTIVRLAFHRSRTAHHAFLSAWPAIRLRTPSHQIQYKRDSTVSYGKTTTGDRLPVVRF